MGRIIIGGRTDLHIIRNGTLTSQRYADEILRLHVVLYFSTNGNNFLLMQDNARLHTAHLMEYFLAAKTVRHIERPVCSHDLKPIEHVWDNLGRRIAVKKRPSVTVRLGVCTSSREEHYSQSLIDNLIATMPNRCSVDSEVWKDCMSYDMSY